MAMTLRIVLVLMLVLGASAYGQTDPAAPAATNAPADQAATNAPAPDSAVSTNAAPATDTQAPAAPAVKTEPAVELPVAEEVAGGRFAIGTRLTYLMLLKESGDFMGHIDKLDAEQNLAPYKLFARWYFFRDFGLELTWDEVKAKTYNEPDEGTGARSSDATYVISGPILTALWRHRTEKRWTPWGGAGLAFMKGDVEHEGWWHYGYSSQNQYEQLGSPTTPNKGLTREFELDDPVGLVLAAGCDVTVNDRWSVDLYARYMNVEVKNHYTMSYNGTVFDDNGTKTEPLSNIVFGLGAKYTF
jgi:outer membrane protein W